MTVEFNEKELFALLTLVHADFLDKRNKGMDASFEEALEAKLVTSLLMAGGHWPKSISDNQHATALQIIEAHRILEEQK